jgi:YVTN family beta-propeller protein
MYNKKSWASLWLPTLGQGTFGACTHFHDRKDTAEMNKAYRRLIMAITIALAALALTFLTVGALELTPPYVIDIKIWGASRPRNIAVRSVDGLQLCAQPARTGVGLHQNRGGRHVLRREHPQHRRGSRPLHLRHHAAGDPIRVLRGQQLSGTVSGLNKPTSAVAVLTSTHYAYVVLPENNAVAILNGTQIVNPGVTVGYTPTAIAANPATGLVYAVNSGSNSVSVIQGQAVITTIAVGITPTAVTVNPVNGYVYVANSGDDTITILQGTTKVGSPIPVGMAPNDIAVNPTNGRVYIVNAGDGSNVGSISILSATQWLTDTYVGDDPRAVDVNPTTGYIYVAGEWI